MTSPHVESQRGRSLSFNSGSSMKELVALLVQDVTELTRCELALAKVEVEHRLRKAAVSLAASVLGATVALFGLAMLCATAVVALAPIIPALWARMLLVSVIYLLFGSVAAFVFLLQLRRSAAKVSAPRALHEARETLAAVGAEVKHD